MCEWHLSPNDSVCHLDHTPQGQSSPVEKPGVGCRTRRAASPSRGAAQVVSGPPAMHFSRHRARAKLRHRDRVI